MGDAARAGHAGRQDGRPALPRVQQLHRQELGDKYAWTSKLYNGAAVCQMAMGRYEDAEKDLVEAINKDSKDPDTLQNLAVCALHLGKPTTRFVNQLKTLTPKPAAIAALEEFEKQFDAANAAYATA